MGIFLVFLVISLIVWLLNQLEEHYDTRIVYPVEYSDFPGEMVVVGDPVSNLNLTLRGQGFNLLEYKLIRKMNPLEIKIRSNDLKAQAHVSSLRYYLPTSSLQTRISQSLGADIEVVNISPDTLFFEFAKQTRKKLPVKPDLHYTFDKQMMLKGHIHIEPDSVMVSGPESVVDTLDQVKTEYMEFSELTGSVQALLKLKKVHKKLSYSSEQIRISIPAEQYTEGTLKKNISVINCPDSLVVRLFPSMVRITYLVGLSNYEEVIPQLFKAYVDYKNIQEDQEKLRVVVEKAPDYLKSYSYIPRRVDYIIERRDD